MRGKVYRQEKGRERCREKCQTHALSLVPGALREMQHSFGEVGAPKAAIRVALGLWPT